ncbi:hypothetical protein [Sphingosinicella microcystinivorans]|uniref:hypothetical protein n=1 Tax=Sphingosinicella microcystinivorans TaxID=335406 RepID=UPI0022F3E881|nr:hypothetical protein [Sphingosinicella microcystinivorans]WBX84452.1 hypothetical protein PE061_00530 [Sphingosinicella microcystinivorans]
MRIARILDPVVGVPENNWYDAMARPTDDLTFTMTMVSHASPQPTMALIKSPAGHVPRRSLNPGKDRTYVETEIRGNGNPPAPSAQDPVSDLLQGAA